MEMGKFSYFPLEEVKSRLRSERLVEKFALKFLADPSYDTLTAPSRRAL